MSDQNDQPVLHLSVWKTDGRVGNYTQVNADKAGTLVRRLQPDSLFSSGVLVIGTLNPMTLINTSEVAWIEVATKLPCPQHAMPGVEETTKIETRQEFDELLLKQWPKWRVMRKNKPGDLLQSLVELTFRGGLQLLLHVRGVVDNDLHLEMLFDQPALTAVLPKGGALYVNPKTLIRARIYHSKHAVNYPPGIFVAEADEI